MPFKYCHILAEAVTVHLLQESRYETTVAEQQRENISLLGFDKGMAQSHMRDKPAEVKLSNTSLALYPVFRHLVNFLD